MKRLIEAKLRPTSSRIELEPFGVTAGMDRVRPIMLFREKNGEAVLPVWMSPLDAGIALNQHSAHALSVSPHDVPLHALRLLGIKLEECEFIELRGNQQYVELKFTGSKKLKSMKVRADFAVSFCLNAKARFFCSRDFLERCRKVDAEIGQSQVSRKAVLQSGRQTYLN